MKNILFYFTGTGNSLNIAQDLAERLEDCKLINIAGYDNNVNISAERVGIVFPVYFWGIPRIVEKFLADIKISSDSYIFIVANCGMLSGIACEQCEKILEKRKIQLSSSFVIKMPENYIVLLKAKSKKTQEKMFFNESVQIEKISAAVKDKRIVKTKKIYGPYKWAATLGHKCWYNKIDRFDYSFNVNKNCIKCGKCEKICPVKNIALINGTPEWNHHCEQCLACINICPTEAINYKRLTQKKKRYFNPNVKL